MYDKLLVCLSAHPHAQAAVQHGVKLAAVHGAELLFLHVLAQHALPIADIPPAALEPPEDFQVASREVGQRLLAAAMREAERAGVMSNRCLTTASDEAACVADTAVRHRCDLIIIATEGRNAVMRLLTGCAIPGLITIAPVPVLICRMPETGGRNACKA